MFVLRALYCLISFVVWLCLRVIHEEVCYVNTFNVWCPRDCVAVDAGSFIYHGYYLVVVLRMMQYHMCLTTPVIGSLLSLLLRLLLLLLPLIAHDGCYVFLKVLEIYLMEMVNIELGVLDPILFGTKNQNCYILIKGVIRSKN